MKPMKLYISGPMRGIPSYNFPAFDKAQKQLEALGHTVFNPAQQDRFKGFDFTGRTGNEDMMAEFGFDIRKALAQDVYWIAMYADAVVVLDGWLQSRGALAEAALATALDLPVIHINCPKFQP